MIKISNHNFWRIASLTLGIIFIVILFWIIKFENLFSTLSVQAVPGITASVEPAVPIPRIKSETKIVKGIYLTASSASNSKKIDEIIKLIDQTELNAVVIDIKDYTGFILYDSQISEVKNLKTKRVVLKNIPELIKKLHDHNIYVIARQTVFQDPILAQKKPEWAIKNKNGGVWRDRKGLAWVNSTNQSVWKYNIAIAKEVASLGFDELNFDYVRFPTDGNMISAVIPSSKERNSAMAKFFSFLSEQLKDKPVYISVDFFGLVMEDHSGMSIGQTIAGAVDKVDYISPMMYPSHYAKGHLGMSNPASNPGKVIDYGMKIGTPLFKDKKAIVRPWLQAFNIGVVYDAKNIRAQIDMVEKYPNAGWLLWNAANRYTTAGLK